MANRCEDYPCCGHTDGLGCNWTYTPEAQAFDQAHAFCEHEAGFCEAEDDAPEGCDVDEDGWCYAHDQESDECVDEIEAERYNNPDWIDLDMDY